MVNLLLAAFTPNQWLSRPQCCWVSVICSLHLFQVQINHAAEMKRSSFEKQDYKNTHLFTIKLPRVPNLIFEVDA